MTAGDKGNQTLTDSVKGFPQSILADWVKIISAGLVIPVFLAGAAMLWRLDRRMAVMEGNRWTSQDQAALQADLAAERARMWEAINQRALRSEVPPDWFIDRMDRLELMIQTHVDQGH